MVWAPGTTESPVQMVSSWPPPGNASFSLSLPHNLVFQSTVSPFIFSIVIYCLALELLRKDHFCGWYTLWYTRICCVPLFGLLLLVYDAFCHTLLSHIRYSVAQDACTLIFPIKRIHLFFCLFSLSQMLTNDGSVWCQLTQRLYRVKELWFFFLSKMVLEII